MDLWELKLTPWDLLIDWLPPRLGALHAFWLPRLSGNNSILVRLRICQQIMLSNRVFNVPRHVAETFWRRRVEGDNPFVSQFFANFVSCSLGKKKKSMEKKIQWQGKWEGGKIICNFQIDSLAERGWGVLVLPFLRRLLSLEPSRGKKDKCKRDGS